MLREEHLSIGDSTTDLADVHYPGVDVLASLSPGESLFDRQSVIRRISREALGLLGGGRAVLLQLAHPMVAAGVADHSAFQAYPLTRLYGTLELMHTLVFGDGRQVRKALERFHTMHAHIQGNLPHAAGRFPAGTRYAGDDPHLKLWVFATLVDTSLMAHERFVAPLSSQERRHYYADTGLLAHLLDIPDAIVPPTLNAFQDYLATMLAGDTLAVTDTSRQLAWDVLDPDVGGIQYACARLLRFVTAGLLPERLRTAYGLSWSGRQQNVLDGLSRMTRLLRPVAPAWLWQSPLLDGRSVARMLLWPNR